MNHLTNDQYKQCDQRSTVGYVFHKYIPRIPLTRSIKCDTNNKHSLILHINFNVSCQYNPAEKYV